MYPKINQNITIQLFNQDLLWKSMVAEIGDEELFISFPMDHTINGLLQNGTILQVSYTANESKYTFTSEIIGRKIETIPLLRLKKPLETQIAKIQQRENFRVNANLRLILQEREVRTLNISAGGLLCSCHMDLPLVEREEVSGTIFVPNVTNNEASPLSFKGEITRIHLIKELDRQNVAVKFIRLDPQDQKKIVQFCFEKQRQLRMKERGLRR
ncbi:flagellar brake protein [Neobacillus fumarioli]|uniref:flagellar brake protein n=1 Tax=Neobacillus fumarioli TaxID=105229 RepID=UPI001470550B|nr:flagellar brake domain-containing protein [Neobacillus fumarioli]